MILALVEGERVRRLEVRRQGQLYTIGDDEGSRQVDARALGDGSWSLLLDSRSYLAKVVKRQGRYHVELAGRLFSFQLVDPVQAALGSSGSRTVGAGQIVAPMPGRVVRILAARGQRIKRGDGVVVVEAMKMENELRAPHDGTVSEIHTREGQTVEGGTVLLVLEPA